MHNPMALNDRRILVTGASSGIGRETAILLSQLGAQLVLVARDTNKLEETRLALTGSNHICMPYDLQEIEGIAAWMKRISTEVGALHGMVHSAGIEIFKPLRWLKQDDLKQIMQINVEAGIALAKAFHQKDAHVAGASLVFLASVVGVVGQAGISAYAATKGAIIALTRSLAIEFSALPLRVNCVAPGVVETPMSNKVFSQLLPAQIEKINQMHLLGLGSTRDVANAIAFLLADTGRWITGTTLFVDGGYTAH